ncbi:MAG: hypothetical protein AB8B50_12825 [Pirellulaceae bacterium]
MIDLYKTLRLEPLESDTKLISVAIESLVDKQEQLDAKSAARASKLIEFAKAHLLSPARKAKYDSEWQSHFGGQTRETAELGVPEVRTTSSTAPRRLDAAFLRLLPSGDPTLRFDRNKFLAESESERESRARAQERAESETYELLRLLQPNPEAPAAEAAFETQVGPAANAELATETWPVVVEPESPVGSNPLVQATAVDLTSGDKIRGKLPERSGNPVSNRGASSASLARKIRRKKDRSLLLIAGGMLGSAALVLATVLILLNRQGSDAGSREVLADLDKNRVGQAANTQKPKVRGSGLGGAFDGGFGGGGNREGGNTAVEFGDPAEVAPAPAASDMLEGQGTAAALDGESRPSMNAEIPNAAQSTKLDQLGGPKPIMEEPLAKPAAVQISEQEREEWRSAVAKIREDLGQQSYNSAAEAFGRLGGLAKTEEQKDELGLLGGVAVLAEDFHFCLMEAIRGLNAGSVLRVKSTELSFVEASGDSIVFRIAGQNQRFLLTELPVGILEALVDLELDRENAESKAKRAAFILLHPRATNLVKPRMLELMREAEDGRAAASGTSRLFEVSGR